ncbi:MAG: Ribokinase [Tenericutes bacterium ADurb.Bin087]|nr:MAG: Ribokinase [Tenericutes bacterium ADurb.Bin087]
MKKVIVLGSINMDLVTETKRFPLEGETVIGENFFTNSGGKGANQAVASAKQGAKTVMLGAVGNDLYGKESLQNLQNYGVETKALKIKEGQTGVAVIILHRGDNRIIVNAGANKKYTTQEAMTDLAKISNKGDILVLQLEMSLDVITHIIPFAKKRGLFIIFNPAPMSMDLDTKVLHDVDLLIVNEIEAKMLASNNSATKVALINKLQKLGAENVIITLGAEGGTYTYEHEVHRYQAYKTVAKDTTGAGDAFVGTIAASLTRGESLPEAIVRASYVSGITVSRLGAQQAIPTKEEIDSLLNK